jgi:hypothetical protein
VPSLAPSEGTGIKAPKGGDMGAHTHKKINGSDRARKEQLKRESKRHQKNIHGEGMKNPKPKPKTK